MRVNISVTDNMITKISVETHINERYGVYKHGDGYFVNAPRTATNTAITAIVKKFAKDRNLKISKEVENELTRFD